MNRKQEALRRLKITPEQLSEVPHIMPLFRKAEGGLTAVLNAMRLAAGDESIDAFLKKYDSIPIGDRPLVPWEAIALSANIDSRALTGAIVFALQAASVNMVKVLALTAHPKVMKKTIEYALMPGGYKDRNTMHQALGFLPTAKGPTFIGKAVFGAGGGSEKEEQSGNAIFDGDRDVNDLFPSAVDMQELLVPIRQRLLEKP